jgi:hypothetical protein
MLEKAKFGQTVTTCTTRTCLDHDYTTNKTNNGQELESNGENPTSGGITSVHPKYSNYGIFRIIQYMLMFRFFSIQEGYNADL